MYSASYVKQMELCLAQRSRSCCVAFTLCVQPAAATPASCSNASQHANSAGLFHQALQGQSCMFFAVQGPES